jgi:hypothetical protein
MPFPLIIIPGTILDIDAVAPVQSVPEKNAMLEMLLLPLVALPLTPLTQSGLPLCATVV